MSPAGKPADNRQARRGTYLPKVLTMKGNDTRPTAEPVAICDNMLNLMDQQLNPISHRRIPGILTGDMKEEVNEP